jgi:hypothetical protein
VKLRLRSSSRYNERGAQKSTLRMRFLRPQRLNAARPPYEPRESADGVFCALAQANENRPARSPRVFT